MLSYPWKCTVLHCNHLGNTWKPLVLMTRHFDYCPSASYWLFCTVLVQQYCTQVASLAQVSPTPVIFSWPPPLCIPLGFEPTWPCFYVVHITINNGHIDNVCVQHRTLMILRLFLQYWLLHCPSCPIHWKSISGATTATLAAKKKVPHYLALAQLIKCFANLQKY